MGDQDCGGAVDRLVIGEHSGVDHHDVAVVLDADAGMAELRDPHEPNVVLVSRR